MKGNNYFNKSQNTVSDANTINVLSVEEIMKNISGDDYEPNQELRVDDIINEYGPMNPIHHSNSAGASQSRFGFNPDLDSSSKLNSRKSMNNIQDEELRKIMEMADDAYPKSDLNEVDFSKYLESLDLNNLNDEDSASKKKNLEIDENLPYKNSIEFINYMETHYIKSKLEANENVFGLKNYKQHAKIKFIVLDFVKKVTLSQRFYRETNITLKTLSRLSVKL
jgi:hypothetical protein